MKNVKIIKHPLVADLVTRLRNFDTNAERFRAYTKTISHYLLYEALSDISLNKKIVFTQTKGKFVGGIIKEKIKFYAVLREGIGMLVSPMDNFCDAHFDLIGVKRNDADPFNSPAVMYFGNFKNLKKINRVVIMDQMFATGGTMKVILDKLITEEKFKGKVDIVSVIVAKMGAEKILKKFPNVKITCAGYDEKLTENGYIYPGLGDAADRYFNNL